MEEEIKRALRYLRELTVGRPTAVMYSGGVDSSLLLHLLSMARVKRRAAVLLLSPLFPEPENLKELERFASDRGFEFVVLEEGLPREAEFTENPPSRCYHCRLGEIGAVKRWAEVAGYEVIMDGVNRDDLEDFRPGLEAAREMGVEHPFVELGWGKEEIRRAARHLSVEVSEKPSSPCLASRIAYGTPINPFTLTVVKEAERILKEEGFSSVRARLHSTLQPTPAGEEVRVYILRIEVPRESFGDIISRPQIVEKLKGLGVHYITLDLQGLRSGSMNEYFLPGGLPRRGHDG